MCKGECDDNAKCSYGVGGVRACKCNKGYTGDGYTCEGGLQLIKI